MQYHPLSIGDPTVQTPRLARSRHRLLRLAVAAWVVVLPGLTRAVSFIRGDVDENGPVDIADAIGILNDLFLGIGNANCIEAKEADDNGGLNITDAIFLLRYLFEGGREPPPPFPDCGEDFEGPPKGSHGCFFHA